MGQTLHKLAEGVITKTIFPNRFVVEICETVHTHYKNLRLVNSLSDWISMAEGFRDALDRWKKRGCPGPSKSKHIELCRKKIVNESDNKTIVVNLNKNLYPDHDGMIFAEGSDFTDSTYIHAKIGDIRVELSIEDFREVTRVFNQAQNSLSQSDSSSSLQKVSLSQEVLDVT